jgi:hypothetical protein
MIQLHLSAPDEPPTTVELFVSKKQVVVLLTLGQDTADCNVARKWVAGEVRRGVLVPFRVPFGSIRFLEAPNQCCDTPFWQALYFAWRGPTAIGVICVPLPPSEPVILRMQTIRAQRRDWIAMRTWLDGVVQGTAATPNHRSPGRR